MKTNHLLIGGAVVLIAGGVVALFLATREPAKPGERAGVTRPPRPEPRDAVPRPPRATGGAQPTSGDDDSLPPGVDRVETRDGGITVMVREHPRDEGSRPERAVTRETLVQLRSAAQPILRRCAAPMREKGVKGRLQITFTVAAAGGRVTVPEVEVRQAGGMDEPEIVDCVTKAFAEVSFAAPEGQADVEGDRVHLPFIVP